MPDAGASTSALRIDAVSLISRFLGYPLSGPSQLLLTIALLAMTAGVVHRLSRRASPISLAISVALICLALLLTLYHLGYDMILLTSPCIALVAHGFPGLSEGSALRRVFIVLFAILATNWISTTAVLTALRPDHNLWLMLASINAICLLALFVGYMWCALLYLRHEPRSQ